MKQGNIVGKRYGKLLVLKIADTQTCKNTKYTCLCDCGKIQDIQGCDLRYGRQHSCARCAGNVLPQEKLDEIAKEYLINNPEIRKYRYNPFDYDRKRIYKIWKGMINRCHNKNDHTYKYYGANGVSVCDEWKTFEPFYKWSIEHGYRADLSIDRINSYGNYEPENCRWADKYMQAHNRRDPKKNMRSIVQLTIDGEYIDTYQGVREAQRAINAKTHSEIVRCCQHTKKSAYGFKWMYEDEYRKEKGK